MSQKENNTLADETAACLSKSQYKKQLKRQQKEERAAKRVVEAEALRAQRREEEVLLGSTCAQYFGSKTVNSATNVQCGIVENCAMEDAFPKFTTLLNRTNRFVLVRGRVSSVRSCGKIVFLTLRDVSSSAYPTNVSEQLQCVIERDVSVVEEGGTPDEAAKVQKAFMKFVSQLSLESVVDCVGLVRMKCSTMEKVENEKQQDAGESPCSQAPETLQDVELSIRQLHIVSAPSGRCIPFPILSYDTTRDDHVRNDAHDQHFGFFNHVNRTSRVLDLRRRETNAIMRLQSILCNKIRQQMTEEDFVEIHTPTLLSSAESTRCGGNDWQHTATVGGHLSVQCTTKKIPTSCMTLRRRENSTHVQIAVQGDLPRVCEIGPAFSTHLANNAQLLTEYTAIHVETTLLQDDFFEDVLRLAERVLLDALLMFTAAPHLPEGEATSSAKHQELIKSAKMQEASAVNEPPPPPLLLGVSANTIVSQGIPTIQFCEVASFPERRSTDATRQSPGVFLVSSELVAHGKNRLLHLTYDQCIEWLNAIPKPKREELGIYYLCEDDGKRPCNEPFCRGEERYLCRFIKEQYGVDMFVIVECGVSLLGTPYFNLPGRSFSVYLNNQCVCTGSQRVHDPTLLGARLQPEIGGGGCSRLDQQLLDAHRCGGMPHGGFEMGLEHLLAAALGIWGVAKVSMFPRSPSMFP